MIGVQMVRAFPRKWCEEPFGNIVRGRKKLTGTTVPTNSKEGDETGGDRGFGKPGEKCSFLQDRKQTSFGKKRLEFPIVVKE